VLLHYLLGVMVITDCPPQFFVFGGTLIHFFKERWGSKNIDH